MSFFWSLPSSVFTVATNFIQIYQKGTVLKGNLVPIGFVKISAWREAQDLVNVLSKGQNFRERNSLGTINLPPTKKKEEGVVLGETHHAATSGKSCEYHETEMLRELCR